MKFQITKSWVKKAQRALEFYSEKVNRPDTEEEFTVLKSMTGQRACPLCVTFFKRQVAHANLSDCASCPYVVFEKQGCEDYGYYEKSQEETKNLIAKWKKKLRRLAKKLGGVK